MSVSVISGIKSVFVLAIHVGIVTLFMDFINFPLSNIKQSITFK